MRPRFIAALIVVALTTSPGFAKGNPHGDKGHDAKQHHEHDRDDYKGHDRDHDRDDHAKARPAGWDKGKKTGWGNCDVPPGQAKPAGCGTHSGGHHTDRHVSTDHHGTAHHDRTTRATPSPRPVSQTTTPTTRSTTTTTAKKGEHPFSSTLRKKKEVEDQQRANDRGDERK
jgi:hypothetical protein